MNSEQTPVADRIGLRVANLKLWYDARDAGVRLVARPSHIKFLQSETSADSRQPQVGLSTEVSDVLVLHVRNRPPPDSIVERTLLCQTEVWELWLDQAGRYIFAAPMQSPSQQAIVDPGFANGEIYGELGLNGAKGSYPLLQGLEIVLFVNWLAGFSDVILHAAGVAVDGKGYCFTGRAGAGKSTLAASLALNPTATVLGEDQVVLRYIDGRFWIFGTPWHANPDLCAPLGVPLEKLFFLDREAPHPLTAIAPFDGVTRLLQIAFVPYYRPAAIAAILDRLALLAERVPFYTLSYRLGDDPLALIQGA